MDANSNSTPWTKSIPTAAAIASLDPLRSVIELRPAPTRDEWVIELQVTCPNARELWDSLHPAPGKPVTSFQSDPLKVLAINQAIFKTSARLRDKTSTITRILCAEVCNG